MVIIGGMVQVRGGGATLLVDLAEQLDRTMGSVGKWTFLVGAWGAVFSSLLGVWQSVPYLFADLVGLMTRPEATSSPCLSQGGKVAGEGANNSTAISRRIMGTQAVGARKLDTRGVPYQVYLVALAVIPAVGLGFSFENAQKWYAVLGALFIPMLALVLLILNGQSRWVGKEHRNSPITSLLLIACLAFFMLVFWLKFHSVLATLGLSGKQPMRIFLYLFRFLLVALLVWVLWWALKPRWDFTILFVQGSVDFRGRFPEALRARTMDFLREDVLLRGSVKIHGRRDRNGHLQLQFSGPVFKEDRQRIRNFLVSML
jgi:hypothetical protein